MKLFLAIYTDNINLLDALFISAFAMIVVFLVLLVISYLIDFVALFVNRKSDKKKIKSIAEVDKNSESTISTGNNQYIIATIAGAIATYLGTSVDNIKIKSIRRVNQDDSPWTRRNFLNINKGE